MMRSFHDDRVDRGTVRTAYTPESRSAAEVMEDELPVGISARNHKDTAGPAESQVWWWQETERQMEEEHG